VIERFLNIDRRLAPTGPNGDRRDMNIVHLMSIPGYHVDVIQGPS
jgi:hypothetical protein